MKEDGMYIIYTRKIAWKLRNRGFRILKVGANPNKPEFDCYYFEDSDDFRKVLAELSRR